MRITLAAAMLALAGTAAGAATLTVDGTDNIFKASSEPLTFFQGGTAPPFVDFTPGAGLVLTISSATGLIDCCGAGPPIDSATPGNRDADGDSPSGVFSAGPSTGIDASGGISGMEVDGLSGFVAGLFVNTSAPPSGTAPADLVYDTGGLSTSDAQFAPALDQTFYIGDGLTGNGSGTVQEFLVPTGADRLYLGILDAGAFTGPPAFYDDNDGAFEVTLDISAPSAIPLPAGGWLLIAGLGGLVALRRARGLGPPTTRTGRPDVAALSASTGRRCSATSRKP